MPSGVAARGARDGRGEETDSHAVEAHAYDLRRKLFADAIRTLRRVGYSGG